MIVNHFPLCSFRNAYVFMVFTCLSLQRLKRARNSLDEELDRTTWPFNFSSRALRPTLTLSLHLRRSQSQPLPSPTRVPLLQTTANLRSFHLVGLSHSTTGRADPSTIAKTRRERSGSIPRLLPLLPQRLLPLANPEPVTSHGRPSRVPSQLV